MAIERRTLQGGRLKAGSYDEREQQLELEFVDGSARLYAGVPGEVWRRLLASPNPAAYHEDRIADEYPSRPGKARADADAARASLDALFGGPAAGGSPTAGGSAAGASAAGSPTAGSPAAGSPAAGSPAAGD